MRQHDGGTPDPPYVDITDRVRTSTAAVRRPSGPSGFRSPNRKIKLKQAKTSRKRNRS